MPLEEILRRPFSEQDRLRVQERVAALVESNPEPFLAQYAADRRSHGGRYINSDLMKEMFTEYRASAYSRNRYNAPVHNSAAVLAAEQFRRVVLDRTEPTRDTAIFLTGIPGAGKTSFALGAGSLPNHLCLVFEGQLANPSFALAKLDMALAAALRPLIMVVHISSEEASRNTLKRFVMEGRGASIESMAAIQGGLPDGLRAIFSRFGEAVEFRIIDRRGTIVEELSGWHHLKRIESEGSYEDVKRNLASILDREFRAGNITPDAFEQAHGRVPRESD
jgi:hypothetical protein